MDRAVRNQRIYMAELGGAGLLYAASLYARQPLLAQFPAARVAILLMPVVPVWLIFGAVLRHYLRIDEYLKVQFLKSTALAGGLVAVACATYLFFQDAGLVPQVRSAFAWLAVAGCWCAATFWVERRRAAA